MTKELLFWIVMLLWLISGAVPAFAPGEKKWPSIGGSFLAWGAVALLGWAYFGAPVN